MQCEYCQNMFKNSSVLRRHQKTATYCLKLRGEKKNDEIKCPYCKGDFSSKQRLIEHMVKCMQTYENYRERISDEFEIKNSSLNNLVKKLQEQLIEKDKHIARLEDKLENIAIKLSTKPTTTNNISIHQNLQPLTQDKIQNTVENYSLVDAMHGGIGIAKLALKNGLNKSVVCTDLSRMSAKYKNEEGKVVTDPGLRTVSSKIFSSIEDKNNEIMDIYAEGNEEDDPFVKVFKLTKAAEIKTGVQQASQDDGGDIYRDFAKYVCQKTLVK